MAKQYVIKNLKDNEYQYFQTCAPEVGGYWVRDIKDASTYSYKDAKYEDDTYMYYETCKIVEVKFYVTEFVLDFTLHQDPTKNPIELRDMCFESFEEMKTETINRGIYSFDYGIKEVK